MVDIRVRKLKSKTIVTLIQRAQENGRSLNEEVCAILYEHVAQSRQRAAAGTKLSSRGSDGSEEGRDS